MPCPKSQYQDQFEQSNHQALQKRMADLKACLPSGSKDTAAQLQLIMKYEEWPEEDSDKEMELEMVKLKIELEMWKVDRLKRVELRRTEEDMNFHQEVTTRREES